MKFERRDIVALGAGWSILALLSALTACAWGALGPGTTFEGLGAGWAIRRIESSSISESSGLVASRVHAGVFWTHNDSGDTPRLFAIDAWGRSKGEFSVEGAQHLDWEDIAADDSGHLYIGDFGNNSSDRRDLTVYRVPEPVPNASDRSVQVDRVLHFRYADQVAYPEPGQRNFDAEAMFWMDGALYVFTKHRDDRATHLYRLPVVATGAERVLEPVARYSPESDGRKFEPTAADMQHAPGGLLAVLNYGSIDLLERDAGGGRPFRLIHHIDLDRLRALQVESLAWDGDALLFGNEQRTLFRIPDPLSIERYPPKGSAILAPQCAPHTGDAIRCDSEPSPPKG